MDKYMVLIHPWNTKTCYVKERGFFLSQGGLTEKWGKAWRPVGMRPSIERARLAGLRMFPKGTYTIG